jgi:transposase
VPDERPGSGDELAGLRAANARLRRVVEAKDTQIAALEAGQARQAELIRKLELRVAELERQLGADSTNSGTPTSGESAGARERRKAERKARQVSERERRKDRRRGGQPGHPGSGLARDLDPDERKTADPPVQA